MATDRGTSSVVSVRKICLTTLVTVLSYAAIPNNLLTSRVWDEAYLIDAAGDGMQNVRLVLTGLVLVSAVAALFASGRITLGRDTKRLWGHAAFFGLTGLLCAMLGAKPAFTPQLLILPVAFTGLLALKPSDYDWFTRLGRAVALVYMYGSLAGLVLFPERVLETQYTQGYLFQVRLHGVASLANQLAPLVVLFFGLDWLTTRRWSLVRIVHWMTGMSVLLLTQSKTVWVALPVSLLIVGLVNATAWKRLLVIVGGVALVGIAGAVLFAYSGSMGDWVQTLTTLTGRNSVWLYTIEIWKRNPWFGYGPDLWRDETRLAFLQLYRWAPGQAHNQFLQTLGQAGILGLASLLLYLITLLQSGWKYAPRSRGVTLLFVLIMLLRSVTESALASNLFVESITFQFFAFGLLLLHSKERADTAGTGADLS